MTDTAEPSAPQAWRLDADTGSMVPRSALDVLVDLNDKVTSGRVGEYQPVPLGFTPMETLVAATRMGGEIMGRPDELGQVKPGYLADLLLVDGDPLADIKRLQRQDALLVIMKDGRLHKAPATT